MSTMTQRIDPTRSLVQAGIARVDITPTVGIYHRMWGAATHDRSTGVHRPLTATALVLAPLDGTEEDRGAPQVAIAIDHCLLWAAEMETLISAVAASAEVDASAIRVYFSHTHGAGLMGLERRDLPGGDLIPSYLDELATKAATAVRQAIAQGQPATITYALGRCGLATNRDYLDPATNRYVCGFNPDGTADGTLLIGRITGRSGVCLGTILNYACHPTTLAWDNTLISPDYVGAAREVLETETNSPCFFIQGASGDVGPRHGFVGDCEVADANGRQLGHAALAALTGMLPPDRAFRYAGPVVSGATIGTWVCEPLDEAADQRDAVFGSAICNVELPLRDDLPDRDELLAEQQAWQAKQQAANEAGDASGAADCRAMVERATRRLVRVGHLPQGDTFPYQVRIWRMGNVIWVPLNGEHYNVLQTELRRRFPDLTLVIATIVNGSEVWYLPDANSYGKGLYQEEASILARGSLELLIEALTGTIRQLVTAPAGDAASA